jgi:hypothetical protein
LAAALILYNFLDGGHVFNGGCLVLAVGGGGGCGGGGPKRTGQWQLVRSCVRTSFRNIV